MQSCLGKSNCSLFLRYRAKQHQVLTSAGDVGLEIAPGKDVDENPDLREIGNIWNAVSPI